MIRYRSDRRRARTRLVAAAVFGLLQLIAAGPGLALHIAVEAASQGADTGAPVHRDCAECRAARTAEAPAPVVAAVPTATERAAPPAIDGRSPLKSAPPPRTAARGPPGPTR
jgi:hypothetical protein